MKYIHHFLILFFFILYGCSEGIQKELETSKKIIEANKSIEENIKKAKELKSERPLVEKRDLDGPFPADTYSVTKTNTFYFSALYRSSADSLWITIEAKSKNDIEQEYSKLIAYKTRPDWLTQDQWLNIRRECINQKLLFDLRDEPKGWLKENATVLK